jgi:hypothetical protein
MGLGAVGAHHHPITHGQVVQKSENRAAGARFSLGDVKQSWERVEGGSMEAATMCLGAFGAHDCPIARGEPDGAKKQEPSHRGSAFPGRCEMRLGEGKGGSNRGVRMSLGAVGARNTQGGGRGPLIPVNQ